MEKDKWDKFKIIGSTILIPVVIVILTNTVNVALKDREIGLRMVELAIEFLKSPPDTTKLSMDIREWSIEVIDKYSDVPFSEDAREALKEKPLPIFGELGQSYACAHVTLESEPTGAKVYLVPFRLLSYRIDVPEVTPVEIDVMPWEYEVVFVLSGREIKKKFTARCDYDNIIKVSFK